MFEKYVKLRDARGVTDYAVATECGIARSTFSDWKKGKSKPKQEKLQKIADFFNVPISYFYDDEQSQETPFANPEYADLLQKLIERPELKTLLRVSEKATKEDIEAVVRLLDK